ncbi:MAG: DUF2096 domain-containing protein [Euryarchaeota archaeon]|nr:DUF2096 domain-containing protein [Euryarchaeota archaeon]
MSRLATREMAVEMKRKGMRTGDAMAALRNAKSVLNECRLRPESREVLLGKAYEIIGDAQKDLFIQAGPLGEEFTRKWESHLKEVMKGKKVGKFPAPARSFYPGMPRDGGWVRISRELDPELIKALEERFGLDVEEADGAFILKGDRETLKEALKEISRVVRQG